MLQCIIVDDEAGAVEILSEYVRRTPHLLLAGTFRDPMEALNYIEGNEVDLVFLDIEMPNLSGIQLSGLIRDKGVRVVFCTAYPEYAVQSYDYEAFDYLLKPVPIDRFLRSVNKAVRVCGEKENTGRSEKPDILFIKSGPKIYQLDLKKLYYMEKDGHYILFHTDSGQILSRMNMRELLEILPENNFARIHKSYVVALDKLKMIEKHSVYVNDTEIPIGDSYKSQFFQKIRFTGS